MPPPTRRRRRRPRLHIQGLWFSSLLSLFGDKEARILVLGLDNAGKTTILCEWEQGEGRRAAVGTRVLQQASGTLACVAAGVQRLEPAAWQARGLQCGDTVARQFLLLCACIRCHMSSHGRTVVLPLLPADRLHVGEVVQTIPSE